MKRISVFAASLVLLAGSFSFAGAQPRNDPRFDPGRPGAPGDHRDFRGDHSDWRKGVRMRHDDWQRGRRLDYREYRLRRPPRGYEWREIDGRFVLGVIATGLIADIIINAH
jgi:Ni/Co efflux regulator RcnB